MFFNYGHFSQRPAYFYVYAKSSSQSSEEFPRIGNPNLDPEVSVQYELGAGHQFSDDKAIKVSVYNKDIYDYPASTTIVLSERGTRRSDFTVYRNLDYARSRGIEVELRKRRSDRASWAASYTFSNAKGKSSDPNNLTLIRESGGDARETSLDEEFMWWNRPHKLTAWFNYNIAKGDEDAHLWKLPLPDNLRFNAYFLIQSGRAYTPEDLSGAQIGVAYSKNGPFDSSLNATLVKGFEVGGRKFELTIQGWNLLNRRNAIEVDPVTGKRFTPGEGALSVSPLDNPDNLDLSNRDLFDLLNIEPDVEIDDLKPGTPEYEEEYNRQTQELADGLRRQILATVYRYSDPSVVSPPRHVRVGIGMEW